MNTTSAPGGNPRDRRPLRRTTMAQALADDLTEQIIDGEYAAGTAIPTEPELAEQYQVSRSVVRDAVRIVAARGLVDVQHGRGAFVTASPVEAIADAFRLALRREHATAWDVEAFLRAMWPDTLVMAAANATVAEMKRIRETGQRYLETAVGGDAAEMSRSFGAHFDAILDATHNAVLRLLSPALRDVRSMRHWEDDATPRRYWRGAAIAPDVPQPSDREMQIERESVNTIIEALESRDADRVRAVADRWMALPVAAVEAMKRTPVGETVDIPIPLPAFEQRNERDR